MVKWSDESENLVSFDDRRPKVVPCPHPDAYERSWLDAVLGRKFCPWCGEAFKAEVGP